MPARKTTERGTEQRWRRRAEEEGESSTSPSSVQPSQFLSAPTPSAAASGSGAGMARPASAQTLRVRRSTYVPGWAVPPRVLLVDDDVVSRKVSSKFLQIFGCTIDVAVDGVGAVNKMNLEKYDLVLMVRSALLLLYDSHDRRVCRLLSRIS